MRSTRLHSIKNNARQKQHTITTIECMTTMTRIRYAVKPIPSPSSPLMSMSSCPSSNASPFVCLCVCIRVCVRICVPVVRSRCGCELEYTTLNTNTVKSQKYSIQHICGEFTANDVVLDGWLAPGGHFICFQNVRNEWNIYWKLSHTLCAEYNLLLSTIEQPRLCSVYFACKLFANSFGESSQIRFQIQ